MEHAQTSAHRRIVMTVVFLCLMMIMTSQSDSLDSVSWQFIKSSYCQGFTGTRRGEINLSRTVLHYMVSHGNPTPKNSAMQIGGKVKSV